MLFTEPAFLFCFLPVLIGLYFAAPKVARNLLLLAASLLFYAKGGGYFTYLLIVSVVFNYTMAIWIHRLKFTRAARPLLGIAVGSKLVVLAIFNYATFGAETINDAPFV
jgi:alginate O-acetyltransferase complex protein AlgI